MYKSTLFAGLPPPAAKATTGAGRRVAPTPPAPKPPELYVIEVIKGDKRENQTFPEAH